MVDKSRPLDLRASPWEGVYCRRHRATIEYAGSPGADIERGGRVMQWSVPRIVKFPADTCPMRLVGLLTVREQRGGRFEAVWGLEAGMERSFFGIFVNES